MNTLRSTFSRFFFFFAIVLLGVSGSFIDYTQQDSWPGMCNKGRMQSPIEFSDKIDYIKAEGNIHLVSVEYHPLKDIILEFRDGNSLKANFKPEDFGGIKLELRNTKLKYDLVEINFHVKAEHISRGVDNDLEIQLVHKLDKDYVVCHTHGHDHLKEDKFEMQENEILIISLLFKISDQETNPDIAKLNVGKSQPIDSFDLKKYVTKEESFYFYKGSLTIPECDEPVNWMVYEIPHFLSESQLKEFVEIFKTNGYENGNARQTQELHNREVFYHSKNIH